MKKCGVFLCLAALVIALAPAALASEISDKQAEAIDTEGVENSLEGFAADIMEDINIKDGIDVGKICKRLWEAFKETISETLGKSVVAAAMLIFTAVLCSIISSIVSVKGLGDIDCITLVGVVAVAALSYGGVRSFVTLATETMDDIHSFAKVLLPCLTAAAAASGTAASGAAKYAAVSLFMDILISAVRYVILPLIYTYMAASIASAAFGGDALSGAAGLMKWAATNILTVIVLVFTIFITVSGVVSGTADAASTRLTKTVLQTALPVVGSIIADAAGTVFTGIATLKNAVGVFGLMAVAAICLIPFLKLGINYVVYKAASLLAQTVADKNISSAIGSVSTAIGISLGAAGSCAVMLFFSIISVMRAVGVA